jgi:myo-inositol-1(or 4)-monophosphatase
VTFSQQDIDERFEFGKTLIAEAGAVAMGYFNVLDTLEVKTKGPQDLVSEADYNTEVLIKDAIKARFPDDAFFGEETGATDVEGAQGIWVVDPIDGTQPFLMGMASWCVSIAFISGEEILIGLVYSPAGNEFFAAQKGKGATLNGKTIRVRDAKGLHDGIVSVGYSNRTAPSDLISMMTGLLENGGTYHRNGSGALGVCYVGSGALIGYIEHHINAWDCLAGLLVVQEAGGRTNNFIRDNGLHHGGNIVAASPTLYDQLKSFIPRNPPIRR